MSLVLPVVVAAIGVWIAFSIVVWATGRDGLQDNDADDAPPGLGEEGTVTESGVGALRFDTRLRGYRMDQVDAALNRLAWEIGRRDEMLAEMEKELAGVESPDTDADVDADAAPAADGDAER